MSNLIIYTSNHDETCTYLQGLADTERLEKLFELYTTMTAKMTPGAKKPTKTSKPKKAASQTISLEDL